MAHDLADAARPAWGGLDPRLESFPPDWIDGFPPDDWYTDTARCGVDAAGDPDDEFWELWGEGSHGDGPAEPAWALEASARVERDLLAAAAGGTPGGPSAQILHRWCPDGGDARPAALDAPALLDGISGLQRLINWAQAAQQRYVAALARPGVAAPLGDAIELASCPLGMAREVPDVPAPSLLTDPAWGPAIRSAAIKLAAVEVGCALRLSPVTARSRTERAVVMVDELPDTLGAQQAGDLDGFRASIIAERTAVLEPEHRHVAERRVLPVAADRTPGRLRALVDAQVSGLDPNAAAKRERHARRGRGVRVQPGEDGMATVRADVTGPEAQISFGVLDRIAATIQSAGLADGRGRSQIRADVFTDIFQTLAAAGSISIDQPGRPSEESTETRRGAGERSGAAPVPDEPAPVAPIVDDATDTVSQGVQASTAIWQTAADRVTGTADRVTGTAHGANRAASAPSGWVMPICVNVYVHGSTLAGWDDRPGELDGHGIISADFARALAESAGTVRAIALTPVPCCTEGPPGGPRAPDDTGHSGDPIRSRTCGTVLDAGRAVYRPRPAIADHVTARDRTCTFPGCRARADRCDLDHRQPWDRAGATCRAMSMLCAGSIMR